MQDEHVQKVEDSQHQDQATDQPPEKDAQNLAQQLLGSAEEEVAVDAQAPQGEMRHASRKATVHWLVHILLFALIGTLLRTRSTSGCPELQIISPLEISEDRAQCAGDKCGTRFLIRNRIRES